MLLFEPLLSCLGRMFWVIVILEDSSTSHFQCSHWVKEVVTQPSRPVPLAEKHPQSIRFPPPCFTVGMVFLGLYSAFLFLQTQRLELMPNSLIWLHHLLPSLLRIIRVFFAKLQTGLYMCLLQQSARSRILILHGVVCYGSLRDCGPNCLQVINKLLLCSTV